MKFLTTIMPLASFIIAFCSVFAGLGFVFNLLLGPIVASQEQLKDNQVRIEKELTQFKTEMTQFKTDMTQFKADMTQFKTDMTQFKTEVNAKLDKLLSK